MPASTRHPHDRRPRWIPAALLAPLALAACYDGAPDVVHGDGSGSSSSSSSGGDLPGDGAPEVGPPECVDTRSYFEEEVFRPILQAKCFACHNDNGAAKATDFILQGDDYPGYLEVNYNTLASLSRLEIDGIPLVLRKPTLDDVEHGGGKRFEKDGPEYLALATMIELFDAPIHCAVDKDIQAYFSGVQLLDEVETLRKSTLLLGGRLPSAKETEIVRVYGMEGLDAVLDTVMTERGFYERVKSLYNDRLLTDAYLPGRKALDVLDPVRYKAAKTIFANDAKLANYANDAIAREPLNIIENVLRKPGAPFTEIITAEYTMLSPYSAQAYGLDPQGLGFKDPADPNELIEYDFEDIPQAGILTTIAFLNRYPDTPTNRSRARSRYLFDFFLGEDVLQLAARPIDIDKVQGTNPTLFDSACNVCHNYIDPVAGAFQNFSFEGWYRPERDWYADMVPPGYQDAAIDSEEDRLRALPWIAERVAEDDGFALSVVYTLFQGLTGDAPLHQPLDASDPNYRAKVRAFEAQDATFKQLAQVFVDSDYDFRALAKAMVKTPWLRAKDVAGEPTAERLIELAPLGSSRSLSPELLDQRIRAAFGFQWTRNGASALLADANYRFFYGGIDSINVTTRLKELSGVMNNIAERMAGEVACRATAPDLSLPAAERRLFPFVELHHEPTEGLGEAEIRRNIQHLHEHLLGERLEADDHELDSTYQLFTLVLKAGRGSIVAGDATSALPAPCKGLENPIDGKPIEGGIADDPDYKVRAWMAVITYLLGDYEFLYE